MTELIKPGPEYKVLEIGTGSGYQAAILAEIIDSVFTMEIIPELGSSSAGRLKNLGYENVEVKIEDGYFGWKEHAPYDAIIVTAATEYIPPPLLEQLKDGGKMVIPIGSPFMTQWLMLVEKDGDKITTTGKIPVRFVPFRRSE
jgi:protein-L-isoaspartate(D-aspartate) O-methyltransferase